MKAVRSDCMNKLTKIHHIKEIFVESVHDYPPVGVRNLTFILLDVDGEFRKVMFVSYGRTYIGWIDHYCDDVYGCYGR